MRLKSYQAETMAEAMRQIREELGEDAVIVATHRSRRGRGVEITAAVEPAADPALNEAAPVMNGSLVHREGDFHGAPKPPPDNAAPLDQVRQALAFHALPAKLADKLCFAAGQATGGTIEMLAAALRANFTFQSLPVAPSRPILLAGSPGSGKTVTAAKLAARAVMAGFKVTVITCDTVRAGGVEQLAAFIDLLRQPLIAADSPQSLAEAIARAKMGGPVFIDTPGTNPYDAVEFDDLKACIQASGAEAVLVAPAGADTAEAADAAARFAAAGASKLLPTRLDVARRYGSSLTAAAAAALPLAGASTTAFVAQGLRTLSTTSLARLLLRDPGGADLESAFDEAAV